MTQTAESGSGAAAAPAPAASHGFHGVQYVLHRLWCSLLGRMDIAADDDFFAIGGTDESARELCRRIADNLGCDVAFETFRSAPTFEALSVLVRTSSSGTREGPLLRLQRGAEADRGAIYCFHPISGSPVRYAAMVDYVDPVQPVYGVQAIGLLPGHEPDRSIEAMADRYSRAILRHASNRAAVLLGYSSGGVVAFEAARRLEDSALDVTLGIVDSCPVDELDADAAFGYASVIKTIFRLDLDMAELMSQGEHERLETIRTAASQAGKLPATFALDRLQRIIDVCNANAAATAAYRPEPWQGRATVFESDDGRALTCAADWSRYINDVTTRPLAGDHETVVEGESLAAIAHWAQSALIA